MKRTFKFTLLFLCLCVAVPTAYAQHPCSLQTMAGTYAMYERGSSFLIDPSQQPYPLHWAGAMATFINVGEVTFSSKGLGNGFYWILIGALNGGLDPIPVQVTITEMNPDCTGKFTYLANLPGGLSATVEERFVLFDNGREFRSIPTTITNGVPTLDLCITRGLLHDKYCNQAVTLRTPLRVSDPAHFARREFLDTCHVDTQTLAQRVARMAQWNAVGRALPNNPFWGLWIFLPEHNGQNELLAPCSQIRIGGADFGQSRIILRTIISPWYIAS